MKNAYRFDFVLVRDQTMIVLNDVKINRIKFYCVLHFFFCLLKER